MNQSRRFRATTVQQCKCDADKLMALFVLQQSTGGSSSMARLKQGQAGIVGGVWEEATCPCPFEKGAATLAACILYQ